MVSIDFRSQGFPVSWAPTMALAFLLAVGQPSCGQDAAVETQAGIVNDDPVDVPVDGEADPAVELLDKATQKKLFAKRISDLDSVVSMCEEAIALGLPEGSDEYAKELIAGALYEKASQVLAPVLQGQMDRSWRQRRRMALEALDQAADVQPNHGDVQLLIAQLADLPDGDREAGLAAAENAVKLLWDNPARRSEAILSRAAFRDTMEEKLEDINLAVEADETNAEALRERARVYLETEETEKAIADYMKVIELDESDTETREMIVRLLASEEKFDAAIKLIDELIAQDESAARGYLMRADIWSFQDETEKAMADVDKAIEIEPGNLLALLTRAQLNAGEDKLDEAMADIDRALELKPGSVSALLLRSSVARIQGNFELALRDLKRILRRDPGNVALQLDIASLYVLDQRPRKAIEVYSRIIDENEMEWEALRGRADARLGTGEHAKAITDYEKALPLAGDDSGLLNNYAWVLATSTIDEVRDGEKAITLAEKACEVTDYQAAHILSTLAASHAESGNFEEAIKWSGKAVELGGGDPVDGQLKNELESYRQGKPWRERQITEERTEVFEQAPSDLELDEGETGPVSSDQETARVPSDP